MKNFKIIFLLVFVSFSCTPKKYKDLADGLYADMQTSKGNIILELYADDTPLTVANFVGLAEGNHPKTPDSLKGRKYFDGLRFYRVVPNFIIQAGDVLETGSGNPGFAFADEFPKDSTGGFKYKHDAAGVLSMANPGPPNTNGSQFFITHKATPWLDGKHSIFGKVVKGLSIVDSIVQLDTILTVKIIRLGKKANNFDASSAFLNGELIAKEVQKEKDAAIKKAEAVRYATYLEARKINYTKMGADKVTATSSGLKVLKLKTTKGKKVTANKIVTINYTLFLGDGTKLQSTLNPGSKPFTVDLGEKKKPIITGFKEGLTQLRVGEKARLFIPYYIAYGEKGGGPFPPKADIIFEVEILKIGK